MRRIAVAVFAVSAVLALGCHRATESAGDACKIALFAASSLSDVAEVVRADFLKSHPGCSVSFNFGSSNSLGLQIEAGARANVFLSAAAAPVDHLAASGKVELGSKLALFSNRLSVISHQSSKIEIKDACALRAVPAARIAIGQPDAVPAGIYAKAYLEAVKCPDGVSAWSALEGRMLPLPNVRAVLSVVEQQPDLLGIVYQTDALASKVVKTQFVAQGLEAPRIRYFGLRVGPADQARFSDEFLSEFSRPEVQHKLTAMGFVLEQS